MTDQHRACAAGAKQTPCFPLMQLVPQLQDDCTVKRAQRKSAFQRLRLMPPSQSDLAQSPAPAKPKCTKDRNIPSSNCSIAATGLSRKVVFKVDGGNNKTRWRHVRMMNPCACYVSLRVHKHVTSVHHNPSSSCMCCW